MSDEATTNGLSEGTAEEVEPTIPEMPPDAKGAERTEWAIRRAQAMRHVDEFKERKAQEKAAEEAAKAKELTPEEKEKAAKAEVAKEKQKRMGLKEPKEFKPGEPKPPDAKAWAAWNKDKDNFNRKVAEKASRLSDWETALASKTKEVEDLVAARKAFKEGDYVTAFKVFGEDPHDFQMRVLKQKAGQDPRTTKLESELAQLKQQMAEKEQRQQQLLQEQQRRQQEQQDMQVVSNSLAAAGYAEHAKHPHFVQLTRNTILERKAEIDAINSDPELDGEALAQARLQWVAGIANEVRQYLASYWGPITGDASASVPADKPDSSAVSAGQPKQAAVPADKPVRTVAKPLKQAQAAEVGSPKEPLKGEDLMRYHVARMKEINQNLERDKLRMGIKI